MSDGPTAGSWCAVPSGDVIEIVAVDTDQIVAVLYRELEADAARIAASMIHASGRGDNRCSALARTAFEEGSMWVVKAITA